jgi:hypothetical protein
LGQGQWQGKEKTRWNLSPHRTAATMCPAQRCELTTLQKTVICICSWRQWPHSTQVLQTLHKDFSSVQGCWALPITKDWAGQSASCTVLPMFPPLKSCFWHPVGKTMEV